MEKTEGQMLESIYDDMQEVKRQVKDLQLTLENETNRKSRNRLGYIWKLSI